MSDLVRVQVMLKKSQKDELVKLAQEEGVTVSELVRSMIDAQLRRRKYADKNTATELLKIAFEQGFDK